MVLTVLYIPIRIARDNTNFIIKKCEFWNKKLLLQKFISKIIFEIFGLYNKHFSIYIKNIDIFLTIKLGWKL